MEELSPRTSSQDCEMQTSFNHEQDQVFNQYPQSLLCGLHQEISRLQQQCSTMQQQLIYQGLIPSTEDILKQKVEDLENRLCASSESAGNLRTELCKSNKLVEDLKERLHRLEERYQEDVSARNLIVVRLRREVQEKTEAIGTLTSLLRTGLSVGEGKVPSGVALQKTYSGIGPSTGSLPSVWNPSLVPSIRSGDLAQKILRFQPKTEPTATPQSQCHPRTNAALTDGKPPLRMFRSNSPFFYHQELPQRTLKSTREASGELSAEPSQGDLRRDANSQHS